jgi:hypothetical protein
MKKNLYKENKNMTLKTCLEIGLDCKLETIGEAVYNIDLHAISILDYNTMNQEISHLYKEAEELYSKTNFTKDSLITDVLMWINMKDDGTDEIELNL